MWLSFCESWCRTSSRVMSISTCIFSTHFQFLAVASLLTNNLNRKKFNTLGIPTRRFHSETQRSVTRHCRVFVNESFLEIAKRKYSLVLGIFVTVSYSVKIKNYDQSNHNDCHGSDICDLRRFNLREKRTDRVDLLGQR